MYQDCQRLIGGTLIALAITYKEGKGKEGKGKEGKGKGISYQ